MTHHVSIRTRRSIDETANVSQAPDSTHCGKNDSVLFNDSFACKQTEISPYRLTFLWPAAMSTLISCSKKEASDLKRCTVKKRIKATEKDPSDFGS